MSSEKYFYKKPIPRGKQQKYIKDLLKRFEGRVATENLRREIIDLLMKEKFAGRIEIPFQVVLRKAVGRPGAPYIDVILESKV